MTEPRSDRPHVPGYGIPKTRAGVLPWSWAVEHLEAAIVYWLATTGADRAPHVIADLGRVGRRPLVRGGRSDALADATSARTRRWRSTSGPAIEVVIVEGTAVELVAPAAPVADAILGGYAKYKEAVGYTADAANWASGGLWELHPVKAFAWSTFPTDMTRFRF